MRNGKNKEKSETGKGIKYIMERQKGMVEEQRKMCQLEIQRINKTS